MPDSFYMQRAWGKVWKTEEIINHSVFPVLFLKYSFYLNKIKLMKFFKTFILLICLIPAVTYSQGSSAEVNFLNSLYNEKQFFKLKKQVIEMKDVLNDRQKLYYNSLIDNAFNDPGASNAGIDKLLKENPDELTDSMKVNLYNCRVINSVNLFDYKDSFEAVEILLSKYKPMIEEKELKDYENSAQIFKAGFTLAPQTVEIKGDTKMKTKKDLAGLVNIKAEVNGMEEEFIFDTGANFSTVSESFAKKLGLIFLEGKLDVGTATSIEVSSKLAYAKSLKIGNLTYGNVLFLVLPDEALSFAGGMYVINGIIGFPVIKEMKEIHLSDGEIFIPAKPGSSSNSNLALNGFIPVIETYVSSAFANSDTLVFSFDTGAKKTMMYYSYYEKYKSLIDGKYEPTDIKFGGAGGEETLKGFKINDLNFRIFNENTTLKNVSLLSEKIKDKDNDKYIGGNLGGDFFNSFKTMIINFEDMFVQFEN